MAKRPADTAAKLSTILWAALGYLAKKRTDKTLIPVGKGTKVNVTIEGTVGRAKICERLSGVLELSPDGSRAKACDAPAAQVVALLLRSLPDDAARAKATAAIVAEKERTKQLPNVTAAELDHAKQFLTRLRSSTTQKVAGALVFALAKTKAA